MMGLYANIRYALAIRSALVQRGAGALFDSGVATKLAMDLGQSVGEVNSTAVQAMMAERFAR